MRRLTGQTRRGAGRGFTLVELLLATVLMLLLLGAAVVSLAPVQRGASLEEGALQLEGLLRYARAYAAQTGRPVQIHFDEEVEEGFWMALGGLRVVWEPDPLAAPGELVDLKEAAPLVRGLMDLVVVEKVQGPEADADSARLRGGTVSAPSLVRAAGDGDPPRQAAEAPGPRAAEGREESSWSYPPITFFPDGSSDSAEIVVKSRHEDDPRRWVVRLNGLTGTIQRSPLAPPDESQPEETEPAKATSATASSATAAQAGTRLPLPEARQAGLPAPPPKPATEASFE